MGGTATAEVVKTGNDFAIKFSQKISGTPGNVFSSPYSVRAALGMCSAGSAGETRKAFSKVLDVPEGTDEQNAAFGKLVKEVNGDGSPREYDLTTANALWRDQTCVLEEKYKAAVAQYYGGDCNGVNFLEEPEKAVVIINDWVSNKTNDKIKNLVNEGVINPSTRLVLTNAIYFKGKWELAFKKENTTSESFSVDKTSTVQAPTMKQKASFAYYEDEKIQALDMPYKGGDLSMLVVLPQQRNTLGEIENVWSDMHYKTVVSHLHTEDVQVSLPKFKLETSYSLKPTLEKLGLGIAFSDQADFSGISKKDQLKISEVIHKAFVAVDEEGTEAAAATAVVMKCLSAAMPARPKVFHADHPFLFFIRNRKTGTILFSGRLANPVA